MILRRALRVLTVCVMSIAVAGCLQTAPAPGSGNGDGTGDGGGDGGDGGGGGVPNDTVPTALVPLADGFVQPLGITTSGDGSGRLFVVEQRGTVRVVDGGIVQEAPYLDLRGRTSAEGERGLLGIAFHPDFADNGRLFAHFTTDATGGDSVIAEFTAAPPDASSIDVATERVVLTGFGAAGSHHGGQLAFGPDGYLYIAVGDRNAPPDAQDVSNLTGSVLRIDVDGAEPYEVPADNPFVGTPGERDEIWAYGFRNPWRMSFDTLTGDLWIADVGEDGAEEVNRQGFDAPGGENYGWPIMEGDTCLDPPTGCEAGLTLPTLQYLHSEGLGRSVTGGHVYRGSVFGGLSGSYVFADFISGRVFVAEPVDGGGWEMETLLDSDALIVTIGLDDAGELLIVDYVGGVVYGFAE